MFYLVFTFSLDQKRYNKVNLLPTHLSLNYFALENGLANFLALHVLEHQGQSAREVQLPSSFYNSKMKILLVQVNTELGQVQDVTH
jgi:hypothetical protein